MSAYLSQTSVQKWTDRETLNRGRALFERGGVSELVVDRDTVTALVTTGERAARTRFRIRPDGTVDSHCPCPDTQDRGLICFHVVAAGYLLAQQTEDPVVERNARIARRQREDAEDGIPVSRLHRGRAGAPGCVPAVLRLRLDTDLSEGWKQDKLELVCHAVYSDSKRRLDKVDLGKMLSFPEHDTRLLYALEDLAGAKTTPGSLTLSRERFLELLSVLAPGELAILKGDTRITVSRDPIMPVLTVELNAGDGTLRVTHQIAVKSCQYLFGMKQCWVFAGDTLHPLEAVLPPALRAAYSGAAVVPREQVIPFLREELPQLEERFLVDSKVAESAFTFRKGAPSFSLELTGSAELLQATLWACYGGGRVRAARPAQKGDAVFPVADDATTYETRNLEAEQEAVDWLENERHFEWSGSAFKTIPNIEAIMSILANTVPVVRQRGWQVEFGGLVETLTSRAEWITPVVSIRQANQRGWFDVDIAYTDGQGNPVASSTVDAVLASPGGFAEKGGRIYLVSQNAVDVMNSACSESLESGSSVKGRVNDVNAGYLSSTLAAQAGITVKADEAWVTHAKRQTGKIGLEPVPLGESFQGRLRPYQQEGVNWLRFLETAGYAGILADEMGLGKTIQALAWLQLERVSEASRGLPSLVVCPTSLVENWAREAARFAPHLSVRVIHGSDRHRHWETLAQHDLIVTSYALLRRDIERYTELQLGVAILDEAQHIKNRSTLNAQAAKQIRAVHRVVLTGTPMENSVSDLWSIMDFLLPGYLGSPKVFRESFERPVNAGGPPADVALRKLRCKMQPFMLRRLKAAVAADLPAKVTRIATCSMSADQAELYRALAVRYQEALTAVVQEKGFEQARFAVLKTLLRLRQVCCHPALLKQPDIAEDAESAKLDLFLELLDEARDGGQRVLVFSQFVEMLHILRKELDARSIRYAYLDGSTQNRQEEVDRFNTSEDIPVFLISLKAGGSGLNLTGASVVIHFDPWWNPAVEDQATDRAHRIGQTRSVYSIKLVTAGTVEEKVLELQDRKRRVIDATVGGETDIIRSLTWDDVQQLIAIE